MVGRDTPMRPTHAHGRIRRGGPPPFGPSPLLALAGRSAKPMPPTSDPWSRFAYNAGGESPGFAGKPYRRHNMSDASNDARENFFGQRAHSYRLSARHARGQDLDRLLAHLDPPEGGQALDLATGAGHVAVRLAGAGLRVTALDPTAAMLDEARELARERGAEVAFVQTVAEHLPFADDTFDVAVCRRAAHHFSDLAQALSEAARVLKPGGFLGISDMTAPREAMPDLNRIEQIRDPSHVQARTPDEWVGLLLGAGLRLQVLEVLVEPMTPEEWLSPVTPEEPEGAQALLQIHEFEEPTRSMLTPEGTFVKYRLLAVAHKPA